MAQIKVGLTNGKTSFWDPNTRAYITLSAPVQTITFDEARADIAKHLERICHACFASNPTLKLYEGQIPQEAIDHWKAKFNLAGLNIAKNRADRLHAQSAQVVSANKGKVEEVELKAAAVEAKEVVDEKEEQVEEAEKKPAATRTKKKTAEK